MCGTGKGLLRGYVLLSPFLRTESYVSARIPLPPLRGTLSPGEGFAPAALASLNNNLHFGDGPKFLWCYKIIPDSRFLLPLPGRVLRVMVCVKEFHLQVILKVTGVEN